MAREKTRFDKRQKGKTRAQKRQARGEMLDKQASKKSVSKFNVNKSGKNHISGQEMKKMMQMRKNTGESRQDVIDAVESSGAQLGGRAQKKFDRMKAKQLAKQQQQQSSDQQQNEETAQQAQDLAKTHMEAVNTGDIDQQTDITNTQEQDIEQDNDINTTITGDGNTVISEQDNSIRQYGGDNRSLVINEANTGNQNGGSGSGGYEMSAADKAITYGTLGGFYDVDDSPAAQAAFVDQQQTMNADAQKKYSNAGLKTASKYVGFRGGDVDRQKLDYAISGDSSGKGGMTNYFFDLAKVAESKTFGDRDYNSGYKPTPFVFGDPQDEVKSNAQEIADKANEELDDI